MMNSPKITSGLIGTKDIAEIAGLKSASAVSNWRKRHESFPKPRLDTPSGALFDFNEVEDWLLGEGKIKSRVPARTKVLAQLDSLRDSVQAEEAAELLRAALVYLFALRQSGRDIPDGASLANTIAAKDPGEKLKRSARLLTRSDRELEGLLAPLEHGVAANALDRFISILVSLDEALDEGADPAELFNEVVDSEARTDRLAAMYATPPSVVNLVAALVGNEGSSVLDPAMGGGALLFKASKTLGADDTSGREIDSSAETAARSRFFVGGLSVSVTSGNSLVDIPDSEQHPKADVVVIDPPFSLSKWGTPEAYRSTFWKFGEVPPRNADFCWIQFASLLTSPGGRGYCFSPVGSTFRGNFENKIREKMIEQGVVEAVIALPPRLRIDTSIPTVLWVLRSVESPEPGKPILMIDATALAGPGRIQQTIPKPGIHLIAGIVKRWRRVQSVGESDADLAASVSIDELQGSNLSPSHYIKDPALDLDRIRARHAALLQHLGSLKVPSLSSLSENARVEPLPSQTQTARLGDAALIVRGRGLGPELEEELNLNQGATELLGLRELLGNPPRSISPEWAKGRFMYLQAGDVVFSHTAGSTRAVIIGAEASTRYLGPNAWLIRTKDPDRLDPGWIHLALFAEGWLDRASSGGSTPSLTLSGLNDLEIPLPPIDNQRATATGVEELASASNQAQELADLLNGMKRATATLAVTPAKVEEEEG